MKFVDLVKPTAARKPFGLRWIAVLIPAILVCFALSNLVSQATLSADDDKREGESVKRDADRDQPRREGERETRRDGDREQPRREGERGERERDERERDERERDERERGEASDFRPQTDREAVLFRMIQELRREVEALRREVHGRERGADARRDAPREGDAARREGSREGDRGAAEQAQRRAANIFAAYDKNKDKQVVFQEWIAMREGVVEGERLAREKQAFAQADRSRDERLSLEEFAAWMTRGRGEAREGAPRGPREGDGARREGDRREGDRPRDADRPRDGDKPRDGERRDGDKPREE